MLWVWCLIFLLSIAGIFALALNMKGRPRKAGYIVGIVILSVIAQLSVSYGFLTICFVYFID